MEENPWEQGWVKHLLVEQRLSGTVYLKVLQLIGQNGSKVTPLHEISASVLNSGVSSVICVCQHVRVKVLMITILMMVIIVTLLFKFIRVTIGILFLPQAKLFFDPS